MEGGGEGSKRGGKIRFVRKKRGKREVERGE